MRTILFTLILFTALNVFAAENDTITFVPTETTSETSVMRLNGITVSTAVPGNTTGNGYFSYTDRYTLSGWVQIKSAVGKIYKVIITGYSKSKAKNGVSNFTNKQTGLTINKTSNVATYTNNTGTDSIRLKIGGSAIHTDNIKVILNRVSDEIDISNYGYASYSSKFALDFTGTNVKAYIMTGTEDNYIKMEEVSKVPAYTGVILKATEKTYYIPFAESVSELTGNQLLSTADGTVTSDGTYYSLGWRSDDGVGFYLVPNGTEVGKNRAYFCNTSKAKAFMIGGGQTTGVSSIKAKPAAVNEGKPMYNLSGQRVGKDYKGIVVQDHHKSVRR